MTKRHPQKPSLQLCKITEAEDRNAIIKSET